jgi:hypothetical protein
MLAAINRYALEPLTREQVYVRRMRLCSDQPDRAGERFSLAYLERFRETLPGKPLLGSHDKRSIPLGRFFAAELETVPGGAVECGGSTPLSRAAARRREAAAPSTEEGWDKEARAPRGVEPPLSTAVSSHRTPQHAAPAAVTYLVPWFYMVKTAENEEIRRQIDAGVWSHVSIGFRFADLICDLCGRSYWSEGGAESCRHVIGRVYDGRECTATYGGDLAKVEAVEGSLVYLGCQRGAEMIKSSDGLSPRRHGDTEREEGEKGRDGSPSPTLPLSSPCLRASVVKAIPSGAGTMSAEGDAVDREYVKQVERQRDEAQALRQQVEEELRASRSLATDGELYRRDLQAEIRRLAGIVGAEKEAGFLIEAVPDAPASRLKELVAEYERLAEKLFPPQGVATPGAAASESRDPRAPRAHTVL